MVQAEFKENSIEIPKGRAQCVSCLVFTMASLAIIAISITVGVVVGFATCYVEHRTGRKPGIKTESISIQIAHTRRPENETAGNKTKPLSSSVFLSRILNLGQSIVEEEWTYGPWPTVTTIYG